MICIAPLLIFFLILPFVLLDWFSGKLFVWYSIGPDIPLYIRIIPIGSIFLLFTIFRLKNSDAIETTKVAIFAMASFMIFSYPYLRWFQPVICYGILK